MQPLAISRPLYDAALEENVQFLLKDKSHLTREGVLADAKDMLGRTLNMAYDHILQNEPAYLPVTAMETSELVPAHMREDLKKTREQANWRVRDFYRKELASLIRGHLTEVVADCLAAELLQHSAKSKAAA